jgi:hypothetical protein
MPHLLPTHTYNVYNHPLLLSYIDTLLKYLTPHAIPIIHLGWYFTIVHTALHTIPYNVI